MDKDYPPEGYPISQQLWSDQHRRTVWFLISRARKGLNVELSPIIASAFVILQHYFKNSEECPYKLFVLMIAALFTACKAGNCFRPIEIIYQELNKICKSMPLNILQKFIGSDEFTSEIFPLVTQAEIDLLQSIDFNPLIELPFDHFERWSQNLRSRYSNEVFIKICNKVIVDICLVLCSKCYLDLPPEVAAAAAAKDILDDPDTCEWYKDVTSRYGSNLFDLAVQYINEEKSKTASQKQ